MQILGQKQFGTEQVLNALTDNRKGTNLIKLGGDIHIMFVWVGDQWCYRPFKLYGHSEVLIENDELVISIPQSNKSGVSAQAYFNNIDDEGIKTEVRRIMNYMDRVPPPKYLQ
jgi:hypothetical protein